MENGENWYGGAKCHMGAKTMELRNRGKSLRHEIRKRGVLHIRAMHIGPAIVFAHLNAVRGHGLIGARASFGALAAVVPGHPLATFLALDTLGSFVFGREQQRDVTLRHHGECCRNIRLRNVVVFDVVPDDVAEGRDTTLLVERFGDGVVETSQSGDVHVIH